MTFSSIFDLCDIQTKQNNSPKNQNIDDCAIRALAYISGLEWKEVYKELTTLALEYETLYNSTFVILKFLRKLKDGWKLDNKLHKQYLEEGIKKGNTVSVLSFMMKNREGLYLICTRNHIFPYDHEVYVDSDAFLTNYSMDKLAGDPVHKIFYKKGTMIKYV